MSNENQDANTTTEDPSASITPENGEGKSPDAANASPDTSKGKEATEQVPFHEHPRFKALIEEKNQLRATVEELHSQMAGERAKKESPVEKAVQRYVKAGMKEEAARLLVETQYELNKEVVNERVAPIEKTSLKAQNDALFTKFAAEHKDYDAMRPKMAELYSSLTSEERKWIEGSERGLKALYLEAKAATLEENEKKAFERGVQEGYKRKQSKSAVAPSSGASAPGVQGEYTDEQIRSMPLDEYRKNLSAILASRGMRQ